MLLTEIACYSPLLPETKAFSWYAVRTRPRHEKRALEGLEARGFESYLPNYQVRRRWSDRIVNTVLPLFPGYVFCRFDPLKKVPVVSTPGVVSIVRFANQPAAIDESEIEAIQRIMRSGLGTEPCPFLREGERIRIMRGSLEGLQGLLLKKKSEWRLVVSVTMLQRSVSVEIDREWIAAI